MKRGWWILFLAAAACIAVAIVAALLWPGEREPEYKGRKLSAWVLGGANGALAPADRDERIEAIRHIGTNALPQLLKWINSSEMPKPGLTKLEAAALKLMTRGAGRSWLSYRSRNFFRAVDATWAFEVLGPQASPAVPELVTLSQSTNRWVAMFASGALNGIESNATPSLRSYIEYAKAAVRGSATNSVGAKAPQAVGQYAVGHVWRTNSQVQAQEKVQIPSTNHQ